MLILFQPRTVFVLALLAALAALGAALTAQFAFDMKPCILCLVARVPFAIMIPVTLAALALTPRRPAFVVPMLLAITGLFLISAGIAFFHNGVEQHWWSLEGGCPVQPLEADAGGQSTEKMLAELLATPQARCDQIAWSLMGFSITVWNTLFSLGMAGYTAIALAMRTKEKK